jgi:hypothetical protein
MIATVIAAAVITQKIVERIRWEFEFLWGWHVTVLAVAFGCLFSFGVPLGMFVEIEGLALPWWADRALTGFAIGAGSGFVADISGRSKQ